MEMSGWAHPQPQQYNNFLATGLIVVYGPKNARVFALNPAFPGADELAHLIRALLPKPDAAPRLELPGLDIVPAEVSRVGPRDIFGWWYQTAAILAVASQGGSLRKDQIDDALRLLGCVACKRVHALSVCEGRRVLAVSADGVSLHPAFQAKQELIAFASAIAEKRSEFNLRPKIAPPPVANPTPFNGYLWALGEVGGDDRPAGNRAALDGTPVLFGSVARFRAFSTLAVHGSVGARMLQVAARIREETYLKLVSEGWLARCKVPGRRTANWAVSIAEDVPARDQLIALLQRMAERWPVVDTESLPIVATKTSPKTVRLERYFGSKVRSETLLTLAAFGSSDVTTLFNGIARERGRIKHALDMFCHFGMVRQAGFEGNARMYELDPTWFAAAELKELLTALVAYRTADDALKVEAESVFVGRLRSRDDLMKYKRKVMRAKTRARLEAAV
jgi:hypothetical protein